MPTAKKPAAKRAPRASAAKAAAPAKKPAAKKKTATRRPRFSDTPTVKAVRALIVAVDKAKPGAKDSAEAALAIAMAKRVDDPDTTASAAASCGRVLATEIAAMRAQLPDGDGGDPLDQLAKSIADRFAAA